MAEEFTRVGLDYEIWPAKDAKTLTDEDRAFNASRELISVGRWRLTEARPPDATLTDREKEILHEINDYAEMFMPPTAMSSEAARAVDRLEEMGLIRRNAEGAMRLTAKGQNRLI